MAKPLMLIPPLVFAGFAALVGVGMFRDDPDSLPSARAGQVAPEVVITPLAALPTFDSDALKEEGVKLVNFWASWCAPCRAEHDQLMALQAEGVPIYGINYKEPDMDNAIGFLEELGNPFDAAGQDITGRDTAVEWGVYGIPETYVIDSDGVIRLRFAGPITESILESTIRPAIEAARSN
ncbi:DsbE family thiol:disulfide interchange protein [Nereida sp. MMG025]|uniref:DsbE family thiol:disulfide interchange protein n=1 Tax=Nereida sp. MMG025 TaxID=2909981 RepID=UPI001F008E77|nr:DsbE family thiol:disulfide interchange protein [Nereida sp. MMG025]MCF6445433.1 DsbE family thiol:disulfide interchange protein [Nereida sp. MMG025]